MLGTNKAQRIAYFSILVIVALVTILMLRIFTASPTISASLIATEVDDYASSQNGTYVYLSGGKLNIVTSSGTNAVDSPGISEISISPDGTYLSGVKDGLCEIYQLPNMEIVDTEPGCLGSLNWLSDSAYAFFEVNLSNSENNDINDNSTTTTIAPSDAGQEEDEAGILTIVDIKNNVRGIVAEVPFTSDLKVSIGNPAKIAFTSNPADTISKICSLNIAEQPNLSDCTEVSGYVYGIRQVGANVYVGLSNGVGAQKIYRLNSGSLEDVELSVDLKKTINFKNNLAYFNELDTEKTNVTDVKGSVVAVLTGKRFHGVDDSLMLSENNYLVLSGNRLWEIRL